MGGCDSDSQPESSHRKGNFFAEISVPCAPISVATQKIQEALSLDIVVS